MSIKLIESELVLQAYNDLDQDIQTKYNEFKANLTMDPSAIMSELTLVSEKPGYKVYYIYLGIDKATNKFNGTTISAEVVHDVNKSVIHISKLGAFSIPKD